MNSFEFQIEYKIIINKKKELVKVRAWLYLEQIDLSF